MATPKEQFNKSGTNFPLPLITIWKHTSKGGKSYFTGFAQNGVDVLGFFNTKKSNPKEPDLRIYVKKDDGKRGEEIASLWVNVSETKGTKYLTGAMVDNNKPKIRGFINKSDNPKAPYLKIYLKSTLEIYEANKSKGKPDPKVANEIEEQFGVVEEDII